MLQLLWNRQRSPTYLWRSSTWKGALNLGNRRLNWSPPRQDRFLSVHLLRSNSRSLKKKKKKRPVYLYNFCLVDTVYPLDNNFITCINIHNYRIARNFRGLKFSRFLRIRIIPRKFYPRKFYPQPRIFLHCINTCYSNWYASCSSVHRHGSLPILSNLRQINDATWSWSPWSSFSIGAFILHSIGKWENERLVEGGQRSTAWLQQSGSTRRSYPITFWRRVASGRGGTLTPERCRQVALSLAIRSAF